MASSYVAAGGGGGGGGGEVRRVSDDGGALPSPESLIHPEIGFSRNNRWDDEGVKAPDQLLVPHSRIIMQPHPKPFDLLDSQFIITPTASNTFSASTPPTLTTTPSNTNTNNNSHNNSSSSDIPFFDFLGVGGIQSSHE